jgi:hypothetical protein
MKPGVVMGVGQVSLPVDEDNVDSTAGQIKRRVVF